MNKLINILHEESYSCVVENFGQIFTFTGTGVFDLYDMVTNKPCFLKEASIADKVVGKAAAALMILGKVDWVYAEIISLSGLVMLRHAGIQTDFGQVVPGIRNRDNTDWCPLEKMCYQKESPEEILRQVEESRKNMRIKELLKYEQV